MGSASALCHALRRLNKTAYLYNNPEFKDSLPWVTAPYLAPEGFSGDFIIAVDMADKQLYPKGFKGRTDLCIDHHPSNTSYAEETVLDSTKASCGEIILKIIEQFPQKLDEATADLLYIAVSTDTGCFVYGNTTAETLRAGAKLVECGARNTALNKVLFRTSTRARLKLEGLIFNSLRFYHEGRTVIGYVNLDMMKSAGATESDCADLASLPGRAEGTWTSVLLRELEDGSSKVSVRTNSYVNAGQVCGRFGGGGHAMAAGCNIACSLEEAAEKIVAAIEEAAGKSAARSAEAAEKIVGAIGEQGR
jgi:phosphoesterase RecJ-like protein